MGKVEKELISKKEGRQGVLVRHSNIPTLPPNFSTIFRKSHNWSLLEWGRGVPARMGGPCVIPLVATPKCGIIAPYNRGRWKS